MELQQIYELMERFRASGLTGLEWQHRDERIALRREVTAAAGAAPGADSPAEQTGVEEDVVTAPLVGTFYAAPAPDEAPFVTPGKRVKKGDTLCLMEAMKMMSQVPSPADCVVEEVLVKDAQAVGYGQPLFRIRKV